MPSSVCTPQRAMCNIMAATRPTAVSRQPGRVPSAMRLDIDNMSTADAALAREVCSFAERSRIEAIIIKMEEGYRDSPFMTLELKPNGNAVARVASTPMELALKVWGRSDTQAPSDTTNRAGSLLTRVLGMFKAVPEAADESFPIFYKDDVLLEWTTFYFPRRKLARASSKPTEILSALKEQARYESNIQVEVYAFFSNPPHLPDRLEQKVTPCEPPTERPEDYVGIPRCIVARDGLKVFGCKSTIEFAAGAARWWRIDILPVE